MRARELPLTLWRAQGKRCAVCGCEMTPSHMAHPTRGWTIEHVYPRGRYFLYGEGNQLISHAECNNQKADRDPTGCEVILLHAVNAQLGLEIVEKPRCYVDPLDAPSALAVALQEAMAA
jgi:hypothetical protein